MSLFAQLGTRIFGGLFLAALVVIGIQNAKIEGFRFGHVHVWKADFWLINYQGWKPRALWSEAQVADLTAKGKQIEADRDKAVKAAKAERATIQTKIERIVVPAPVAGCDTPPDVMGAFQ